jgi:hypothetical protein
MALPLIFTLSTDQSSEAGPSFSQYIMWQFWTCMHLASIYGNDILNWVREARQEIRAQKALTPAAAEEIQML